MGSLFLFTVIVLSAVVNLGYSTILQFTFQFYLGHDGQKENNTYQKIKRQSEHFT
ncbi:hypothetical protein PPEP_a0301 [Pseudoalteromonas peptidolytica F12-50-A1]|uniref:Uncharacterized protein n=1 Tax=Pseudoalteromonas peptidolytica F12-50-A1 TaxID=1315280 RepID=A0A8I0T3T6_9GAMM|nr:hypothetical protein [Pseudoalteromonas peptidolytica F12-50-A1]